MYVSATTIILSLLVGFIAIVVVVRFARFRRSRRDRAAAARADQLATSTAYDFSIADLLEMKRRGELTEEQFQRAKQSVLSRRPVDATDPRRRAFEIVQPPDDTAGGQQ